MSVRGGLLWSLSSRVGGQFFQIAFSVVLARLLTPEEFGTIGMLLVFSGFAAMLSDAGLGSALIHKHDIDELDISTVFWIQLAGGISLTVMFYALAGTFASFFADERLRNLSRAMSVVFTLQALGQVQGTILRRNFRFKYLAVASLAATLVSGVVAVALAIAGFGTWALLGQIVSSCLCQTALQCWGIGWRPKFVFSVSAMRELGSYGVYLLGNSSLNYWLRNGDNLIIGRFLGSVDLGIYSRAYSLMLLPINNVTSIFGQVMFPALARARDDAAEFQKLYFKSIRLIALVSFPIMAGVAILSSQIVLILYGEQWARMIPILQILAVVGLFQSIISPVGWVYSALGRTYAQFKLSIWLIVAFVVAMALGIQGGILGVTIAYAIWTLLSGLLNLIVIGRLMATSALESLVVTQRIAAATGAMAIVAVVVDRSLSAHSGLFVSAFGTTCAGAVVYGGSCWLLREPALMAAAGMMRDYVRRPRTA